jgi:hypothetical protein
MMKVDGKLSRACGAGALAGELSRTQHACLQRIR